VGLAHHDRRGRRAEARHDVFDPCSCGLAEPAATPVAIGAAQFAGMRALAGADNANVAAAGPLAVDRAVELDLEADEAPFVDRRSAEHIEPAHGLSSTTSTLR